MPLARDTKLGPYEVLAPIGFGGMGEVYRATDTRLKREVALKVLPGALAADPERMLRFQREAEVLASLNHPNIAQIYGVEDRALVMELVEGEPPKGPMPFDEAWKVAQQIVAGLDYAHEKGIVHRDLKPANIKITPDGVVKLLDFGLAKAFTAQTAVSSNLGNSPTVTMDATQLGVILGTAGYMAPEQARGKPVDKRVDIWAFGVVLYELLTGERLFHGEDVTETLAATVKEEPDLSQAPREVHRLLRKCLEKDPKKRLRDIGDAWELLEGEAALPRPSATPARFGRAGWITAAVLALALGALGWVHFGARPAVPIPTVRFRIAAPEGLALSGRGSGVDEAMISPDGKRVFYPGGSQLWVHALNTLEDRPLPVTKDALVSQSFWTEDSRFVVFSRAGKLWKVEADGGPPQSLCDMPGILTGGFSTPDGRIVFASIPGGLQQVPAGGGAASALPAQVDGGIALRGGNPLLPDARHFLFSSPNGISVSSLDGRAAARQLLPDRSEAAFVPATGGAGGYLLFRRESTLLAEPFNPTRLELAGDPFPVAQQVGQFSASPAGTLVYRTGVGERKLTWYDRQGRVLESAWAAAGFGELSLSPDGSRVAVVRVDSDVTPATWLYEFARATSTRLVPKGSAVKPAWAPDGSRLAFSRNADGRRFGLSVAPAAGSGEESALLPKSENSQYPWDWSKDGRWLLYSIVDPKTKEDLWVLPMQGNGRPEPFLVTDATETDGAFSPDGRFVAYVSDESGKFEVYVRSFPAAGGAKWVVSSGGGYQPRWRRDGRELFYFTAEGRLMSVDITPQGAFHASAPKFLFQAPIFAGGATTSNHYWDVAPGGQRFLINSYAGDSAAAFMTVVLNWQAELKK